MTTHARDLKLFSLRTDRLPSSDELRQAYERRINDIRTSNPTGVSQQDQAFKFQEASIAYTRLKGAMKAAPTTPTVPSSPPQTTPTVPSSPPPTPLTPPPHPPPQPGNGNVSVPSDLPLNIRDLLSTFSPSLNGQTTPFEDFTKFACSGGAGGGPPTEGEMKALMNMFMEVSKGERGWSMMG